MDCLNRPRISEEDMLIEPIERRDGRRLTLSEFLIEYAIPGKPVILTHLPDPIHLPPGSDTWSSLLKAMDPNTIVTPVISGGQHEGAARGESYPTTISHWFNYCRKRNSDFPLTDYYPIGDVLNHYFDIESYDGGSFNDSYLFHIRNVLNSESSIHRSQSDKSSNLTLNLISEEIHEISQILVRAPIATVCSYPISTGYVIVGDVTKEFRMIHNNGVIQSNILISPYQRTNKITIIFKTSESILPKGPKGMTIDVSFIGIFGWPKSRTYNPNPVPQVLKTMIPLPYLIDFPYLDKVDPELSQTVIPPLFDHVPTLFFLTLPHTSWRWMYAGPAGSRTPTHIDVLLTSAWMYLLEGKKHWRMIHAEDYKRVVPQNNTPLPLLFEPDFSIYPGLKGARIYEGVLEEGELMFTPATSIHSVVNLSSTLSVTHNYVDWTNVFHLLNTESNFSVIFKKCGGLIHGLRELKRKAIGLVGEGGSDREVLKKMVLIPPGCGFSESEADIVAGHLQNVQFLSLLDNFQ